MTKTRYCYHCRKPHPEDEMRQVQTKRGGMWRCIKSIQAVKKTLAERDAYGRLVSAINAETAASIRRSQLEEKRT